MQLLPCPPGFTRDSIDPRQHAVVVAFDHDRADYAGGGTILPLLSQAFAFGLVLLLLSDQGVPPSTAKAQKYEYNAKAAVCSASTTAQKLLRCIMPLWYNKGIPAELLANFFGTSFDKLSLLSHFWLVPVA